VLLKLLHIIIYNQLYTYTSTYQGIHKGILFQKKNVFKERLIIYQI